MGLSLCGVITSGTEGFEFYDRQGQVVTVAPSTGSGFFNQKLACFAGRQALENRSEFSRREVVPQAIATGQQYVTCAQLGNEVDSYRWVTFCSQTPQENIGFGMGVCLLYTSDAADE